MIFVLLLGIGVVVLACSWLFKEGEPREICAGTGLGLIVGIGIVAVIVWPVCYFTSLRDVVDMETFYDVNRTNYEVTIDQTEEAVIYLNSLSQFQISVENMNQSTNWSERIKELRAEVVEYNKDLNRLRMWNGIMWLDWLFANPPERLKLVRLEQ